MFKVSPEIGSKYRFVFLCAQRTRQLLEGADPRVEADISKPAFIAMQELLEDKIKWQKCSDEKPDKKKGEESVEVEITT